MPFICSRTSFYFLLALLGGITSALAQSDTKERHEDPLILHAREPWKGDLDGMIKRGFIRTLTTYNPLFFSFNGIEQRGLIAEGTREFQKFLRERLGQSARHLNVVVIVVPRDKLISELQSGRGDIVAANLTITPERKKIVDFGNPNYTNVSEIIVTGPAGMGVYDFEDLVKFGITIRRSSSYYEHLIQRNTERKKSRKKIIPINLADERLEDFDLLEMVNAGLIPAVIVDSHKAELWAKIFKKIKIHENLVINTGGNIAWAIRRNSPKLLTAINNFNKVARKGTALGNILLKTYTSRTWIDSNITPSAQTRFSSVAEFMRKYANQYGFDWLMIAAQGYQESKLDQGKKSQAGAVGIMQLLPTTAADRNVGIPDIRLAENNIHAGVKYLAFLRDTHFTDAAIQPLDRVLFSFAAYNAGPGNIARARRRAATMGLDPNRWFNHTEVAATRVVSEEPFVYVRNILKYYVMYKKLEEAKAGRKAAKQVDKK